MRFENKVAVITGSGSGIGKETALLLAKEGAKIVLVGRTLSKLEKATKEINEVCDNNTAITYTADVTKEEEVKGLSDFLKNKYGNIDILINNAGSSGSASILELDVEDWEAIQNVNVTSVFLVSKHLSKLMIDAPEKKDRAIVNIASLSGHKAGAKIPHYSTAKAGVIHFSKALAAELAPYGIRVNSVSPGFTETPLTEQGLRNDSFVKAIERHTALRRVGNPTEIANVIAFAASSEASYMTGTDLLVDGGWLIT